MSAPETIVVDTGSANLASVLAGLRRAGLRPVVCREAAPIAAAERVVLPGVGAFAAAMEQLERCDLCGVLRDHACAGRPLLAICLGMQLLAEGSEEGPGTAGLGVFAGRAERFPAGVLTPQLGWNRVRPTGGAALLEEGFAYFANSYRLGALPAGWGGAESEHGGRFAAAIERGSQLACQFHPELSGRWGLELIRRWAASAERGGAAC